MPVEWTKEQENVIRLRNRNILVSAAAGSGKTAVLVERIIQMLTDSQNPVDVDRLLIVTFTDAAAAEMKERIRGAIEKKVEEEPENEHLQRQATLIHSAQITTIHSFCLSVIREHFHVIDIDPGFRTAEEGELKLLKQDVLEELLEACYVNGEESFLELSEKLGSGRDDRELEKLVLQIYEYSRSYPQPEVWLTQCAKAYQNGADVLMRAVEQVRKYVGDLQELLEQGMQICEEPDGPYMYLDMLEADQELLEKISDAGSFAEMYDLISDTKWKRLSSKKDEEVLPKKREQVKALREQGKKIVKNLKEAYFYEEPDELLRDMEESYETMQALTGLVRQFSAAFTEKKQKKNLIDFHDMEQYALQILTEEQEGKLVPSLSAREYQEQYVEVMIDEYQDSNLIQEAILTSVSTVSRGKPNIFMVGDVKQSIYRFRLSRPELFMEKYDTYSLEERIGNQENQRQRIDLHRNFRSRKEVLDSVNDLFYRMMRKELGGVLYDEQAALYPGADFGESDEADAGMYETELLLLDPKSGRSTGFAGNPEAAADAAGRAETALKISGNPETAAESAGEDAVEESSRQKEARMVGGRIRELMQNGRVKDQKTGEYRKVQYRDIVILTRSVKGWADVFAGVLMDMGIPAYAPSREGYFETYEVSILLDFLRLLDNQRQDLPLTAVLVSPLAGCSAQELAEIRAVFPGRPFYEAVQEYVRAGRMQWENEGVKEQESERTAADQTAERQAAVQAEETQETEAADAVSSELWVRLDTFYRTLEHFRVIVPYTAIHDLLGKILEETGLGLYLAAMPGGAQRTANLEMLIEKAAAFEGTSYKGLFHFVRYIEQLKTYDIDYGEASLTEEQADTVRILSIHKSKGLEFPIVFVAGLGKQFNTQDVKGSIVIHPEWGIGVDAVDLKRRTRIPTLLKKMIQQEIRTDNLGEELRVLYVAMTRAKEKLILTGQLPEAEMILENMAAEKGLQKGALPYYLLSGAKTVLDWMLPALCGREAPVRISVKKGTDLAGSDLIEAQADVLAREVLEHWDAQRVYDEELNQCLEERLNFRYPHENVGKWKRKFTVSELKKRAYLSEETEAEMLEEPEVNPLIPQFLQEASELSGASRGSAYHKLLELLDFSQEYDPESLRQVLDDLREKEKLSAEMAQCIRMEDILAFLHCGAGKRMHLAAGKNQLYKEQPFVLGVDAQEIYPEEPSDEVILVQGIIDVYFEEEGELVVLDYKTDQVKHASELKEKYHAQLDYYAKALEQLLGKKVKEKIIYSFTLKEEIVM